MYRRKVICLRVRFGRILKYWWNKAGSPDMDMIVRAAKQAYADEFISELPDGYDTRLTAGGMNLSGWSAPADSDCEGNA